jgi:hypothetical protein
MLEPESELKFCAKTELPAEITVTIKITPMMIDRTVQYFTVVAANRELAMTMSPATIMKTADIQNAEAGV